MISQKLASPWSCTGLVAREVAIPNGLYFFYEDGEPSEHAPDGRVVRIGNHPRSQERLVGRLGDHYRFNAGARTAASFVDT